MTAKIGDIVAVDSGVFVASRDRGKGTVKCMVLEDSKEHQTYVVSLPPHKSSPMYVFNRDILKILEEK